MSELNKKLAEIQLGLHAAKDQQNSFGKYSYRSAEGIMQALKPLLGDATVTLSDDIVQIGDRHYVKATAILSTGDDQLEVSAFARECLSKKGMDDAQLTGSCSSYARKYALCGLFLIDDSRQEIDAIDNEENPSLNQDDIAVNEFNDCYAKKDLAGIADLWKVLKMNRERAADVWRLLSDDVRKVITASMAASK